MMLETIENRSIASIPNYRVLGVRVDAVQIPEAVQILEQWIGERRETQFVAVTGMHGISETLESESFRDILANAGLVVADGMPLVWLGRLQGFTCMQRRVYGPEFMETFFRETGSKYRHFFYGGAPGVAEALARMQHERYGIQIAGTYCPPFRPLTEDEEKEVKQTIEGSNADAVWVGLSTPKQEKWMFEHRHSIRVPVMVGVGAAFDINSGRLKQAPEWAREHGLEWLYRLYTEPRRLWRRYLINGSKFAWAVFLEHLAPSIFRVRTSVAGGRH